MCRTVTTFLPIQRARLNGLLRYHERVRETYKIWSRGT